MPIVSTTAARRPLTRALVLLAAVAFIAGIASCRGGFSKQYEYEEDIHLSLDGSATVYVNASIASLVALRGLELDPDMHARLDRAKIRAAYTGAGTRVGYLSAWRRDGRRFVSVRLTVEDIGQLPRLRPFDWASYELKREGDEYVYRQVIKAPAPAASKAGSRPKFPGGEEIAIRLHLPSKITYHNARDRETGEPNYRRGNILVWDQLMSDRIAGVPLVAEARMEATSILYRTLWLFAVSMLLAFAVLGGILWWIVRKKA